MQQQFEEEIGEAPLLEDVTLLDYYHGMLPKIETEEMLTERGDFLLRKTDGSDYGTVVVLSVKTEPKVTKHFMLSMDPQGRFYFEGHKENSVPELIDYHLNQKKPITKASGALLVRPVKHPPWMINHEHVVIVKKLGEGAFGEVYLAELQIPPEDKTKPMEIIRVAVKTMRQTASRDGRLVFMKEARMMRKYNHKNVVKINGIAVHEHPILIVMEVCPNGSLLSYLRKNKGKLSVAEKMKFVVEAADGLAYLERQACIHRDIAARNCLLSEKNEIKISDFGMSDDRLLIVDTTLEKTPVKWLAPEAMQDKIYSLKTDIWAFGVMVWEIFADGAEPYPGLSNLQTRAKIVVHDYRMKMPEGTPQAVIDVVDMCWKKDPDARKTMASHFKNLKDCMDKLPK